MKMLMKLYVDHTAIATPATAKSDPMTIAEMALPLRPYFFHAQRPGREMSSCSPSSVSMLLILMEREGESEPPLC